MRRGGSGLVELQQALGLFESKLGVLEGFPADVLPALLAVGVDEDGGVHVPLFSAVNCASRFLLLYSRVLLARFWC